MSECKIINAYKKSRTFYDDVLTHSSILSRLYISLFWGVDDLVIARKVLGCIPADFKGRLLDVPAGTCVFTAEKYAQLSKAEIHCVDYSDDMLKLATRKISGPDFSHVRLIQGDVGALKYKNNNFDIVLSMNGVHAFPDKMAAFDEIFRVLKKGGSFIGCFYIRAEKRLTDLLVRYVLQPRGWFTPPYYTVEEIRAYFQNNYREVELHNEKSMLWFCCTK